MTMSPPVVSSPPTQHRPHLTGPQAAAVAKLAYAAGQPAAVTLLCGPAGVGKTTVLDAIAADGLPLGQSVRLVCWSDLRAGLGGLVAERGPAAASGDDSVPAVLLVDDADRAVAHELVEFVERCRRRHAGMGIVLTGAGRLLTLVASDARLEQAVRLRAALPPFTLAESRRLLAAPLAVHAAATDGDAVIRTIHEIAGGVPAVSLRLAEMTAMLAAADPRRRLTADDVETIHRRLCVTAA
jgi:hypothetical protein